MGIQCGRLKDHLVNWESVKLSMKRCGLVIKFLSRLNEAVLGNWLWTFDTKRRESRVEISSGKVWA